MRAFYTSKRSRNPDQNCGLAFAQAASRRELFARIRIRVNPQPPRRDLEGGFLGCVLAEKAGQKLRVCEQIEDSAGRNCYDVSLWHWAALIGRSTGSWRAVTIAERI